ncbi:hypothetical protein F230042K4_21390 [Mediterraneibacter glycyrrhizinilyticus]
MRKNSIEFFHILFYIGNEPKSGLARDLGDCLQSRNVPFGTSGDYVRRLPPDFRRQISDIRQIVM